MFALHFLHGFLGTPNDFDFVKKHLDNENYSCHFEDLSLYSGQSFLQFAKEYNHKITSTKLRNDKNILVGYSMGGRLALHAVFESESSKQKIWDAVILISTNPGLNCSHEKSNRLIEDEKLASRFETDDWQKLMETWNNQAVFHSKFQRNAFQFNRREEDFERKILAQMLKTWSLGNQESFSDRLQELDIPVFWMVGANDEKYVSVAKSIFLKHPLSSICIMESATHRLPWECQDNFIKQSQKFLMTLKS